MPTYVADIYGNDYFFETNDRDVTFAAGNAVQQALSLIKKTVPYGVQEGIKVQIYKFKIEDGKQVKHYHTTITEHIPQTAMTIEDYKRLKTQCFVDNSIPFEFQATLVAIAGDKSRYEECYGFLCEICESLKKPLSEYEARIKMDAKLKGA